MFAPQVIRLQYHCLYWPCNWSRYCCILSDITWECHKLLNNLYTVAISHSFIKDRVLYGHIMWPGMLQCKVKVYYCSLDNAHLKATVLCF